MVLERERLVSPARVGLPDQASAGADGMVAYRVDQKIGKAALGSQKRNVAAGLCGAKLRQRQGRKDSLLYRGAK